MKKVKS